MNTYLLNSQRTYQFYGENKLVYQNEKKDFSVSQRLGYWFVFVTKQFNRFDTSCAAN